MYVLLNWLAFLLLCVYLFLILFEFSDDNTRKNIVSDILLSDDIEKTQRLLLLSC